MEAATAVKQSNTKDTKTSGFGGPFFKPVIQRKTSIGQPGDQLEREADMMAAQIVLPSGAFFQSNFFRPAGNTLQRKCQACEEEEKHVHRKESNMTETHSSEELNAYVNSLGSKGQAMPHQEQQFFESRFGYNFSGVRLHTDSVAAKSAQSINALAYTSGNNIVFNSGQYSPETDSGKKLMAHELTHVVQQGSATGKIQRLGDLSQVPPMACPVAASSPSAAVVTNLFPLSSSTLSAAQKANIASFVVTWRTGGGTDRIRVDGYASTPGADRFNWTLSCNRALAVVKELKDNGVPAGMIDIFANGETSEFGAQANNQAANISTTAAPASPTPTPPTPTPPTPTPPVPAPPTPTPPVPTPPVPTPPTPTPPVPTPPVPTPPVPTPPTPAPAATITSETVVTQPGSRARTNIGVGEEVHVTLSTGTATTAWTATAGTFLPPVGATGATVTWVAPDTAQAVTVSAGGASIVFNVIAPGDVHMDQEAGTPIKHTQNHADLGMNTRIFLLPDTVNFNKVIHHEMNIAAAATGAYSCFASNVGHCRATGVVVACNDIPSTDTVVAGKGTRTLGVDCVFSGDCQTTPPFVDGSISFAIPYQYKVGAAGAFRQFRVINQVVALSGHVNLTCDKAGAHVDSPVAGATSGVPHC